MSEIPKAILDRLDKVTDFKGMRPEARLEMIEGWYRQYAPALGKTPEQCVKEGHEEWVINWLDAMFNYGAYA